MEGCYLITGEGTYCGPAASGDELQKQDEEPELSLIVEFIKLQTVVHQDKRIKEHFPGTSG